MLADSDKGRFAGAIIDLYLRHGWRAPDEAQLGAWWRALSEYDWEPIAAALRVASQATDGTRPPTPEATARLAKGEQYRADLRGKERLALPAGPAAGAAARIQGAGSPWEALARLWEAEDQHAGRRCSAPTPREVGKARWRDFWQTWERHAAPSQAHKTGPRSDLRGGGVAGQTTEPARGSDGGSDEAF